ncbi:unnamed protein product [Ostreobium quekettii]|uniref:Uncharacterized protein n=1 Tax=Ostreobium quekettii TaxID=121088 RepID=A0A8S1IVW6_9CHLO|nr:unnamed protein product [Ostreobium quekettii]
MCCGTRSETSRPHRSAVRLSALRFGARSCAHTLIALVHQVEFRMCMHACTWKCHKIAPFFSAAVMGVAKRADAEGYGSECVHCFLGCAALEHNIVDRMLWAAGRSADSKSVVTGMASAAYTGMGNAGTG